jgi:hypothetical protein
LPFAQQYEALTLTFEAFSSSQKRYAFDQLLVFLSLEESVGFKLLKEIKCFFVW